MSADYSSKFDKLNYSSTETVWEGIIVEITGSSVIIDLKGRMGRLEVPKRMVITQYEMQVGQEVGFLMSYPEVLSEQPNEKYVGALDAYHQRMALIQQKTKKRIAKEKEGSIKNESKKD